MVKEDKNYMLGVVVDVKDAGSETSRSYHSEFSKELIHAIKKEENDLRLEKKS